MKILVAEDDPIASAMLVAVLRRFGHEVTVTADGEQASTAFELNSAQVIVSDWLMPGLNGLDLCRRIRTENDSYVYFILLSNMDAAGVNLEQALSAGVDDFLTKPIKPDELRMRLHVAERILNFSTRVQQLETFIPICSYCKKVRDDRNYWSQIEQYINCRTGTQFSHSICPDCYNSEVIPQALSAKIILPPKTDVCSDAFCAGEL